MSEYKAGIKAWLDDTCTWVDADKRGSLFAAGFNFGAKTYPNRRSKIRVRPPEQVASSANLIVCRVCGSSFDPDILFSLDNFMSTKECPECSSVLNITFGRS